MIILIIALYFFVLVVLGVLSARGAKKTPEDFFVAGRSFRTFFLSMSILATLLSTFTVMGAPGFVYSTGMGFAGAIFLGNAFLSIFIYFLGRKIWYFGKKYGYITPPELFRHRFESKAVAAVMFVVMVTFVLPYLALQPMGGGLLLSALTDGAIPYAGGAFLITLLTVVYVYMSGQRAVAWNDIFQGILLLAMMISLAVWITFEAGGGRVLAEEAPEMVKRGTGTLWTWQLTMTWVVLLAGSLVMQPQIFTRYYAAKDAAAVRKLFVIWPVLATLAAIPVAFIGAYGKIVLPDLASPDQIVPAFVMQYGTPVLVGLVAAGMMAALMSTSSGQILALSSMFTHDVYRSLNKVATERQEFRMGRAFVVILAFGGFLLGLNPPPLMATLALEAFSGIAMLVPAAFAAFYWRRATAAGVVSSILAGELILVISYIVPNGKAIWFGLQPVVPGVALACAVLWLVSLMTKAPSEAVLEGYFGPADKQEGAAVQGVPVTP